MKILDKVYNSFLSRVNLYKGINSSYYKGCPPKVPISFLIKRNSVSHEYKFVYFHIPKAANTTIKVNLFLQCKNMILTKQTKEIDLIKIKEDLKLFFDKVFELNSLKIQEMYKEYFKFTFVRNPFDRFKSAYIEKILSNKLPKKSVTKFYNKSFYSDISVDEFIFFLENKGIYKDPHWARQIDMASLPLKKFDFIGKLENFKMDFDFVQRKIFKRCKEVFNWQFHSSKKNNKYPFELNIAQKKKIFKIYEADFENFKYPSIKE